MTNTKRFSLFFTSIASLLELATMFFIPIYSRTIGEETESILLIRTITDISFGSTHTFTLVACILTFLLTIIAVLLFLSTLGGFVNRSENYGKACKKTIIFNLSVTLMYMVEGLALCFYSEVLTIKPIQYVFSLSFSTLLLQSFSAYYMPISQGKSKKQNPTKKILKAE